MIEFMPPGKQITTFLDTSASYFKRKQPTEIEAHIVFYDRDGGMHINDIKHNLEIYRDIGYIQRHRLFEPPIDPATLVK